MVLGAGLIALAAFVIWVFTKRIQRDRAAREHAERYGFKKP
jgi:hypothetical protein